MGFHPSSLCPPNSIFYKYITIYFCPICEEMHMFGFSLIKREKPNQKKYILLFLSISILFPTRVTRQRFGWEMWSCMFYPLEIKMEMEMHFSEFSEQYFLKIQMQSLDELPQSFLRAHEKHLSQLIMRCPWHELILQKVNAMLLNSVELTSE